MRGCFFDANGSDGVSFEEDGSGIVRDSVLDGSGDDNIDVDHQTKDILIENNELLAAGEGIEVRQHPDSASPGTPVAAMPEPLYLVNNTFVGNPEAVSGGGNSVVLNNILAGNGVGFRSVATDSVLRNNLLFDNLVDTTGSNPASGALTGDPLLDGNFEIQAGRPAIAAGVASYFHAYVDANGSTIVDLVIAVASPPDLGWSGIGGSLAGQPTPVPALSAAGLAALACALARAALLARRGSPRQRASSKWTRSSNELSRTSQSPSQSPPQRSATPSPRARPSTKPAKNVRRSRSCQSIG